MRKLSKSREERAKFVDSQISQQIAAQIRALRLSEHLSQPQLAEKICTSQNQIHRLEKPRTAKPKMSTLKRLANVFDVALVVRFIPFSQFAAWLSGEPYIDKGLSTSALYVPSFDKEGEQELAKTKERVKEIRPANTGITNESSAAATSDTRQNKLIVLQTKLKKENLAQGEDTQTQQAAGAIAAGGAR